jgi:hypothetical protein
MPDSPIDDRAVIQHGIARVDHLRLEGMFGAFHLVDVDPKAWVSHCTKL